MNKYETVVGLEVHAELCTKTKAFCACEYRYGGEVNTQCCPVCAGMPGAMPVLNREAVEYALRIGLACGCEINRTSGFDRKNYFYPDLPVGYQRTQHFTPICQGGRVEFYHKGEKRTVRLTRIHLEEDTAKLLHDDSFKGTLIDFNRCGVPLIEIVSEPDLQSAEEVKDYLEAVRLLLVALGISNGKMQEGVIRCDINVSVRPLGQKEYGTRVEMKNVNTFNGAVQAVEYEANRQIQKLEAGETISQETRRWDDSKGVSVPMRVKEGAADYRYFPESDLPPLTIAEEWINSVRPRLPELPVAKYERYRSMGIAELESRILAEQPDKAAFFEEYAKLEERGKAQSTCACALDTGTVTRRKTAANWITGDITSRLSKAFLSFGQSPVSPAALNSILGLIEKGTISNDAGKRVLEEIFASGGTPEEIVSRLSLAQVSDEGDLKKIAEEVLAANQQSAEDYKNGKSNALGFLVGQCMKASRGKGNPQVLNRILREMLL
jgi:aspartyl-tRNA(Asn)/glutamyl-tRNA(Gln) amidotransferase subunit B